MTLPPATCIHREGEIENACRSGKNNEQRNACADPVRPSIAWLCSQQSQQGGKRNDKWRKRGARAERKQAAE